MQLDAPIIIIGAGRSGSTLLDRMLDAHPGIHMVGERSFMVVTLWKCMLDVRKNSLLSVEDTSQLLEELARLGKVELHVVDELFQLASAGKRFWGMKEIWNGDKGAVDWAIYDLVFPNAIWVHLVRNPMDYARSAIGWTGVEVTEKQVAIKLQRWSRMVDVSRARAGTGRFIEIRYEDLVASPEGALAPLLEMLDLPFVEACAEPLAKPWVVSTELPMLPEVRLDDLVSQTGLKPKLDSLGYGISREGDCLETHPQKIAWTSSQTMNAADASGFADPCQCAFEKFLIIDMADMRVAGGKAFSYWAPLLASEGDTLDAAMCSPYLLLEDGWVIGTPHAVHTDIREKGCGSWSHWGQTVFFSSSDGTDPRQNGREYALMKPRQGSAKPEGER